MELRQVEYFLAVVEHEGIGGAAASLGVAQPTISQALRGLERELGVQLFHRIGRGMVLSAAGRSMVGPSRQILRDVTAVEDLLATADGELAGRLDVMAFPALVLGPLVDLVAEFRQAYPKVAVRFGELKSEAQAASLIEDGHCEFVVAHLPLDEDGLDVVELGEQEYWLVYPADTEVPDGPVPLSALPKVPMVFVPRGHSLADEIEEAIRHAGARPPLAVLSDHREARLPLVLAGIGGTLVERSIAESARDRAIVREVEPRFARRFGIAFDPETLSPVGRAFVELIRARGTGPQGN
ncbi:LysR family transcriptional regulator [Rhodococcus oxybenzonivorans]|uniref:LysR family transcriptional regulator n=1 Tax=Rhodococcus oxybenzonivorans TaxID=1990687 RepID=A0A2S2C173_9NOCA|nr:MULTISPECIES: LysR family transcriptional regulator [Rhodococcus]AWK74599.1 LysR family transcriptional regulator [Rhodococcus oxybenzonivorans]QTJ67596.1 LysR family transcriptional regulator [Rhodococcus sp. ZPP]